MSRREDGAVEPRPQMTVEVPTISARVLDDIARSVEAVGRGDASAPVDLSETFPNLRNAE